MHKGIYDPHRRRRGPSGAPTVPGWVRDSAQWWSQDAISDTAGGQRMSIGGATHAQTAAKNALEVSDYAGAVDALIRSGAPVPAWVSNKLARARTDLGDVKHYLDYRGRLAIGHHLAPDEIAHARTIERRNTGRSRRKRRGLLGLLFGK